jgi:DNA-binding SARP family transcriptional activator
MGPMVHMPIAIKAIGRLRLLVDGRDMTKRLNEQPRLEFLFSYLLARGASGGDPSVDRSALAEEVAPGFPASSQRDRLRKQLHALQTTLGSGLKGLLQVNANRIRLELGGVDTDFGQLSELWRLVSRRRSLIDKPLGEQIRSLLDDTAGREFLSGFSELEHHVTASRSSAAEVVEAARELISGQRADLAQALAEHYEASGHPQASIAYLRAALDGCPGRQDLARLLVAVYMRTGQTALADAARLEFDLQEK